MILRMFSRLCNTLMVSRVCMYIYVCVCVCVCTCFILLWGRLQVRERLEGLDRWMIVSEVWFLRLISVSNGLNMVLSIILIFYVGLGSVLQEL